MDVLDLDVGYISWWRIVGWKFRSWSNIDLGKLVQQFGCATFRYSGASLDHEIVVQVASSPSSDHGERNTRILLNVPRFFPRTKMGTHNFIPIKPNPYNRDLWASIGVERDEVSEVPGGESPPDGIV